MKAMIVAAVAACFAVPSFAQSNCLPTEAMRQGLAEKYGEAPVGVGLDDEYGSIFEVWRSEETGSWTGIITRADGVSCIFAFGTNWQDAEVAKEGEPM